MNTFYKSHTHGQIPLSSKGKALMHTLRLAIQEAIQKGDYNQMNAVAHARGELAKYMSHLEKSQPIAPGFHDFNKGLPGPLTPVSCPLKPKPQWSQEAYDKLLADMRKDLNERTDKAIREAMLYGSSAMRTWTGGTGLNLQNLDKWAPCPPKFVYAGSLKENLIQGNRATMMLIDDPINEQELDMSKKAVATRKALEKVRAAKAAKFQPVGIRFLHGPRLEQIYTYKAKRAAKLFLGQEVVVRNERGTNVGVVVTLDEAIPHGWVLDTLTELTHKVAVI